MNSENDFANIGTIIVVLGRKRTAWEDLVEILARLFYYSSNAELVYNVKAMLDSTSSLTYLLLTYIVTTLVQCFLYDIIY